MLVLAAAFVADVAHRQRSFEPPTPPATTGLATLVDSMGPTRPGAGGVPAPRRYRPVGFDEGRIKAAERYARARQGVASFAVVDERGVMWGRGEHDLFHSASVVKAMLLVAELDRCDAADEPLDDATRDMLTAMITISDNDAATEIYQRVGDEGLRSVAERTGMHDFQVSQSWGYARISAADMALFFAHLDQELPPRFARFGKSLLGSIIPAESWGIPAVADGWKVRFKGGWRGTPSGQLVSQAAELRRPGTTLGMAVLTDGSPSMGYGIGTLEGVASRLLGD